MLKKIRERNQLFQKKRYASNLARQVQKTPCKIHFYNWWAFQTTNAWFYRFAEHRGLLQNTKKTIAFFSVFGPREVLDYDKSEVRVFYTGENLELYSEYADHCLNRKDIDLALGFEYLNISRYLRFPIWLRIQFQPDWNEDQILKHIKELRYPNIKGKNRFCSLIASHDNNGIRKQMVDYLSQIDKVECAGSFMHNDDTLQTVFGDSKKNYLKNFWLNVCPENSDADGYVTEKIFDAIEAGCIPIYWGAKGHPEPSILNKNAFLTWHNDFRTNRIIDVLKSESLLTDFASQPRLLDNAEEDIISFFDRLEKALRELLIEDYL